MLIGASMLYRTNMGCGYDTILICSKGVRYEPEILHIFIVLFHPIDISK